MGSSIRVGRLAGIDIYVHFTFLLLLGWIGVSSYSATGDLVAALTDVVLIGALFFIIVLHELGHALAARYYGIPTRDITLLPIGGVARLARMPEKPSQELVVALAGPAVNVALAIGFGALLFLQGPADAGQALTFGGGLVGWLFAINVWLVVFNLLPAFPMDGGRVLRAVLSMRLGASRATAIAAGIGKGMAILFAAAGVLGLLGVPGFAEVASPMLILVALFVWFGADQEARAVRLRARLSRIPVGAVMLRDFVGVDPDDTLEAVARYARRTFQSDFPVVVAGRLVGLVSRSDLRSGLAEFGPRARVMQVMRRDFPTVSPEDPAERGAALLARGYPVVPVVYYGRVMGLLTPETVAELLWYHQTNHGLMLEADRDRAWLRV